ncbi:MAG: STAS domain-containing protein [Paenisporosarcina sp.]
MHQNSHLHDYLLNKAKQLTEDWYAAIDKTTAEGVYASTNPKVIAKLKDQNFRFHEKLIGIFIREDESFYEEFDKWVLEIARDPEHLSTPTHLIYNEFLKVQNQYLDMLRIYSNENSGRYTTEETFLWGQMIVDAFGKVISRFIEEHYVLALRRLTSQQAVINELSAPVIRLHQGIGLLPVVGDIDTQRAKYLLENTLMECSKKQINHLFVDLSGVTMIDTMVAMQIFQLIDALKIVGVVTTLSGVRPEIAMTAVQLGVNFSDIQITGNLSQALQLK